LPKFRLSRLAEADLRHIAQYTFETWGEEQTRRYVGDLKRCIERLGDSPLLGRADNFWEGLRRAEQGKHVVFYRMEGEGVLILRILHHRMLPGRHEMGETE
jgi:toxin ParE1/3/4